ncbi:MAG TPA: transporter substrate-binding domain-containing protein [Stellaceae bacterium]|jgi:polar amino acid transport system substrate-binding protein|nr:transporter substrate-binding domain-containing protein [Stellaceae bacterium]
MTRSAWQFLRNAFVCLALACFALGAAQAADYSLVTGTDYPPYADAKLPDGGLAVRIVKHALEHVGRTIDIQVLPWSRGFAAVRDGKADGTFPYAPSPDRTLVMQASTPIFILESHIWFAPDRPIAGVSAADLAGKRFCLPIGYAAAEPLQALIDHGVVRLVVPRNLENCVRMVQGNHADFTADDPDVIRAVLQDTHIDLVESSQSLQNRPLVLLVAKGRPRGVALLADFNEGLRRMKADGSYDRLVKLWPGS